MPGKKLPFIARLALTLVSIIALGYLLRIGQNILAPFFLAFLLAMLFSPVAHFLEEKWHFKRIFSTLSCLSITLVLVSGITFFFTAELSSFTQDIPQLQEQFQTVFNDLQDWVNVTFHINSDKQFDYLNQGLDKLISSSGSILTFTFSMVSGFLAFFFFCIVFFIFILNYRKILYDFIIHIFPDQHTRRVRFVVGKIQTMTKSYLIGVGVQIFLVSLLSSGLLLIFGVKYAILLGVLTGLLNVIPYVGIGISMLIACFMAFATTTPITCLYVIIGYLGIHAVDGNLILPFIVGSKVKINALFSFIGILIGAELWGISGMFLCIPAMAIIKIIFERIEGMEPWGYVFGEGRDTRKSTRRRIQILNRFTIEEKE